MKITCPKQAIFKWNEGKLLEIPGCFPTFPAAAQRGSPKAASKVETTSTPGSGSRGKKCDLRLGFWVKTMGNLWEYTPYGEPGECLMMG